LLVPLVGDSDPIDATFFDVLRRYLEPSRHYHNLEHVRDVSARVMTLARPGDDLTTLNFAAVLHDVIYDSRAKDNEERSAEYAQEVLASLGVGREVRDEVARLILLTRKHETTAEDRAGKVLLDADLSILAADEAEYDRYAAAIRREYAWVADEDYRAGRAAVLERFLARPHLYFTDFARREWEPRARANLAREIAALAG
jgi:predicted metal-dependent HD superfamily phosphohydrolase